MKFKGKLLTSLSTAVAAVLAVSVFTAFGAFAADSLPNCSLEFYARDTNAISVVVKSDECTGYEVEYSENSDMSDSKVIYADYGEENIKISDLKPAADYYIRARSCTAVDNAEEDREDDTEINTETEIETETETEVETEQENKSEIETEVEAEDEAEIETEIETEKETNADTEEAEAEYIYGDYSDILHESTMPEAPSISFAKNSTEAIRFNISGTDCKGYQVRYSTNSDMTSAKTGTISADSSQGRISSLKSGTLYYIQLRAYTSLNGEKIYSSWSSKIKGITKSEATTVKFTKYSDSAVRVKISTVACSGYQVRYSLNSNMTSAKTLSVSKSASEARISGLTAGTKYYVQIRTYSKLSDTTYYSSWSKKIAVTAKPAKAKISSISTPSTTKIKVGLKSQICTGYQIQYSSKKDFSTHKSKYLSSSKSSLTIASLKTGTTYYVRVRAYRTCDGTKYYGPWSAVKSQKIYKAKSIVSATTLQKSNSWASSSLTNLKKGASVRVISSSGKWYKVMYGSKTGYVYNLGFKSSGSSNLSRSKVTSSNYTTYLDDLIFTQGKNSYTLFKYVCNHMSYSYSKISRAQRNAKINSAAKVLKNEGELTAVAIKQRGGICYNYAAFAKTLLERAGYDVQYIYGSNKNGTHCWVLIKTSNGYRHIDAVRRAYEYTDYQMKHSSNTKDFKWSSSYPKCS